MVIVLFAIPLLLWLLLRPSTAKKKADPDDRAFEDAAFFDFFTQHHRK